MKQMRKVKTLALAFWVASALFSCSGNVSDLPATAEGFSKIEEALKSKFGDAAFYTDINIVHDKSVGNIVGVTVTKDPESLGMGQWNHIQGNWTQNSEISLEVPPGTQAADFMFQLNEELNLSTLGRLIEESKVQLKREKKLENPKMTMASILFPKNGEAAKTQYLIDLQPENGGTTFSFYYNLSGELNEMDY